MRVKDSIEQKIKAAFSPSFLELMNESHGHSVPAGSETHFKLIVVSESFAGVSPVERHRKIYETLSSELKNGVHALSLHLYTPLEWEKAKNPAASPLCTGKKSG